MSQTLSASTLLAVPLAPLAGAVLAGVFGTTFGGNWIGRRLSHTLTILGVLVAFVLSAMTLKSVAIDGARFNETLYTWMVVGGLKMEVGFLIDSLTAMMMVVADATKENADRLVAAGTTRVHISIHTHERDAYEALVRREGTYDAMVAGQDYTAAI